MKTNFKRMFGLVEENVAGLDIGSSAVKMVQLSRENDCYSARYAAVVPIDNSVESKSVLNAISGCVKSSDQKLAACSLSGPDVVVRDFRFPLLPQDEIESAIQFEAAQVSPFDIEQAEFDYQLMPQTNEHISGVLVAAKKNQIEHKCGLSKDAGLECVLMGVDGLEILNCFTELEGKKTDGTTAILNVGYHFSNLIISDDTNPPFIRDINYAGKIITDKIAQEMGVSAETMKFILAENRIVESQKAFNISLAKACEALIEAVLESTRYCSINSKNTNIKKIHLCGGFSQTSGFIELLNSKLSAKVVLWNPFEKIKLPQEQESRNVIEKNGPSLAVAAGLAMKQFNFYGE
ncbi:MAG: hypothetical protein A2Y10_09695 [Planctomycetes bacterium GWF2_41_51]|nr:MAG: hypothetical protein A2Y10_09695 [Planctomycetes bacterium GWF2_41_51]HBG28254.1 hypothetical protein [Phycisphaerales bacterium]